MKKIVIAVLILVVIFTTSIISFAESKYIKTSEYVTNEIKKAYGEQGVNESKEYLPYAIKAIQEGIILPGEVEDYNSEISKELKAKISERILEKVGKQGNYFSLEEIKAKFKNQKELEEYIYLENNIKDEMRIPYEEGFKTYEEARKSEERSIKQLKENNKLSMWPLENGIFSKCSGLNETEERNKLYYDLVTVLNYNAIQNDAYLYIIRNKRNTCFKYSTRRNSNEDGLFGISFYEEIWSTERNEGSQDYNIITDVNFLGYFGDELDSGKIDAKGIKDKEYMDETVPEILRETLKVIYGDKTNEFMNEIIKDYKVMNNNPSSSYRSIKYSENRKIIGYDFLVDIGFNNGGCSYYSVLD